LLKLESNYEQFSSNESGDEYNDSGGVRNGESEHEMVHLLHWDTKDLSKEFELIDQSVLEEHKEDDEGIWQQSWDTLPTESYHGEQWKWSDNDSSGSDEEDEKESLSHSSSDTDEEQPLQSQKRRKYHSDE
jgi:hypothetical protein